MSTIAKPSAQQSDVALYTWQKPSNNFKGLLHQLWQNPTMINKMQDACIFEQNATVVAYESQCQIQMKFAISKCKCTYIFLSKSMRTCIFL